MAKKAKGTKVKRCISLDPTTEEKISRLVPDVYPSRSELIRSLVRDEIERRNK